MMDNREERQTERRGGNERRERGDRRRVFIRPYSAGLTKYQKHDRRTSPAIGKQARRP